MTSHKPSIVIVPGSFAPAVLYEPLAERLRKLGYETIVHDLPSSSCRPPQPAATMADDAAVFHEIIKKLADQGKEVVLVTHSYGGIVGNESVKGLSKEDREAKSKKGGVIKIVYISSVISEVGKSSPLKLAPDYLTFEGDYIFMDPVLGASIVVSDLPLEEAIKFTEQMPMHSAVSFTGPLTYAAYRWIPVVYIQCEEDKTIPPEVQRTYIERLEKESGKPVPTISLNSGHCPNLSMSEELTNAINKAIIEL